MSGAAPTAAAPEPTPAPQQAPPPMNDTLVNKLNVGECQVPPYVPPGVIDRLLNDQWIFTVDRELVWELTKVARCLGRRAKIIMP